MFGDIPMVFVNKQVFTSERCPEGQVWSDSYSTLMNPHRMIIEWNAITSGKLTDCYRKRPFSSLIVIVYQRLRHGVFSWRCLCLAAKPPWGLIIDPQLQGIATWLWVATWMMFLRVMVRVIPSGKRLQKTMENHHIFDGRISTISMAIFNSKLLVYQSDGWYLQFLVLQIPFEKV